MFEDVKAVIGEFVVAHEEYYSPDYTGDDSRLRAAEEDLDDVATDMAVDEETDWMLLLVRTYQDARDEYYGLEQADADPSDRRLCAAAEELIDWWHGEVGDAELDCGVIVASLEKRIALLAEHVANNGYPHEFAVRLDALDQEIARTMALFVP